jgi:hypothetical protein
MPWAMVRLSIISNSQVAGQLCFLGGCVGARDNRFLRWRRRLHVGRYGELGRLNMRPARNSAGWLDAALSSSPLFITFSCRKRLSPLQGLFAGEYVRPETAAWLATPIGCGYPILRLKFMHHPE